MASESTESASIDCWSTATNWIVAGGSLDASIAYDTSTADAPAAVGGALLVAPPSQDSPTCEIIVSFKKKHDIHMVYVRSTARTYELYYGTDHQSYSKDYLCTVRCSAVATEGAPDVTGEATTESPKSTEQPVRAESHSSDEDGWVEVKVPDSGVQNGQVNLVSKDRVGNTCSNFEIHYEATAEISDATPAVTLTLRLLSLQNKTCVHVEEIYIYADPVESTNSDPPANTGGNIGASLLAMLAPGLLQMPKFGTSRTDNRLDFDSDNPRMHENQHGIGKEFEASYSNTGITRQEEAYSNIKDPVVGLGQEPTKIQQKSNQLRASQKVMDADSLPEPVTDESRVAYTRVEEVLDELVSRVGRIEAFCSRFEENMMKPLICIDSRLQRLEQQLDAFSLKDHTSEPVTCFGVAAPEISFTASDLENRDCNTKYTAQDDTCSHGVSLPADIAASSHDSPMCLGFVVKTPEFSSEADKCMHTSDTPYLVAMDCSSNSVSVSVKGAFASVPESQMRPVLEVKAPEFVSEDDGSDVSLDSLVKDHSGDKTCVDYSEGDESEDSLVKDHSGDKALCLDDAMASALKAFLTSTSVKCPGPIPMDAPAELSNGKNSCLVSSTERVPSVAEHICEPPSSADDVAAPNNLFKELDAKNRGPDATEFGSENNDPVDSSLLAADKIIVASEFPISPHDYIDFDEVSVARNCLEDQARSPGALMVFLSSKMAKSSKLDKTLLDGSLELSNGRKNELASCTGISFVEDEYSARANYGTNKAKVNLDLVLGDLRYSTGLCRNTNESCLGGGDTEDSDSDEAATEDSRLNLYRSFSSTDSSSNWGLSTFDLASGLAAEDSRSTPVEPISKNYDNNTGSCKPLSERSVVEIEQALRSVGYFDPVVDLNGRNTHALLGSLNTNYGNNTGSFEPCSDYGCGRSVVEIEKALRSVGHLDLVDQTPHPVGCCDLAVDKNGGNTLKSVESITNINDYLTCCYHAFDCTRSIVEIEQALRSVGHFDPVDQAPHPVSCSDLAVDMSGGSTLTSVESIANINEYSTCCYHALRYCDPELDLNGGSTGALGEDIISNNDHNRGSHEHSDYSESDHNRGSHEHSDYSESDLALWCLTDYYGSGLDLDFVPRRNWKSEVPLEGLPEIFTGTAIVGSEGTMGSEQQECDRLPFDSSDQKVRAGDQLIPGIDDAVVQPEIYSGGDQLIPGIDDAVVQPEVYSGGGAQQGPGSSSQLPFASLI